MLTKNKKTHRAVTSADAHVTIFSVLPSPEAEILTKNKKKFFETLATNYRTVTSENAHVTIISVLPSSKAEILTNNKKQIFEVLTTQHRAVTSADAHVAILSVLLSPEAKILTKTKNFSKSSNVSLCGDVSKCPRDHFQRSISTRSRDIDKKQKKNV
ncbi:hypothetical protein PUN28_020385 [Cardiocondyla obscurior]|uniref:Protein kinase A anchor protein nuclear localisation signal domain-containing protein n=1 Tax=Cardiocondyla obscurior TaxID=286306 RepID=A0AAW2E847_9HYME